MGTFGVKRASDEPFCPSTIEIQVKSGESALGGISEMLSEEGRGWHIRKRGRVSPKGNEGGGEKRQSTYCHE